MLQKTVYKIYWNTLRVITISYRLLFCGGQKYNCNEILSILTPIETIPGIDMYNSLKMSDEGWAPVKSIRIIELVNSIIADGINPVLVR